MNGGFTMQRSKEKSSIDKELNRLSDVKLQNDSGKWRRACHTKSVFFMLIFMVVGLLMFSNITVGHHQCPFLRWRYNKMGKITPLERQISEIQTPERPHRSSNALQRCSEEPRSGKRLLPQGIVQETSDFELQPLGRPSEAKVANRLLAIAAGIKQKPIVDKIVQKFLPYNFAVMLFHYDGVVDKWNDLDWSASVIHIAAVNQTKWWFAKRFLHPDVVAPYEYIFLWDEDLGVEHFHVDRYLKIMKDEQLEISQPALDPDASEVHHRITVRSSKSRVHRRSLKLRGTGTLCLEDSTDPPCTGWVEGMAPVFTRDAWRCAWHLIQNDLVHGWGLDFKLGYCAKGDRSKSVGVIDSEYIVHRGIRSLGGVTTEKTMHAFEESYDEAWFLEDRITSRNDPRTVVRRRSYEELNIFSRRWREAVKTDACWRDPYKHQVYTAPRKQVREQQ